MEELEKQNVMCIDRRIIKQLEYEAKINTKEEKVDLANAHQIVIRKLESGSLLEFRGADKTPIPQIPVKNNSICAYATRRTKLKRWPKKAFSQQVKIQFLDQEHHQQSITFNVDDVYLEDLTKEIDAIKSKDCIILDNVEDVEYHGNFKDVEKIVIVPIESMMTMNSGSVLEFRGIDEDVILQIPIKNISLAYPRAKILTKNWRRRILD